MADKRERRGLPGGRAHYRTKDAYASQSREYESRIDQASGYLKAVLQTDFTIAVSTQAIIWQTTSLSKFVPAIQLFGWTHDATSGKFTCRRPGTYILSFGGRVSNAAAGENFALQFRITRGTNTYAIIAVGSAGSANVLLGATTDFDFKIGDIVSLEFNNGGGGNRTLLGMTAPGTASETQSLGFLNLWEKT